MYCSVSRSQKLALTDTHILAALERTYLAYLRTSLMLANVGVIITQLFAIERADDGFGYAVLSRPFATTCYSAATLTVVIGAYRTWRYQDAMINGRVLSGGFEINFIAALFFLVRTGLHTHSKPCQTRDMERISRLMLTESRPRFFSSS